jgi:GT2 family glycosyltransferase
MTTVTVIIPTFNRAQKVARAISSVLGQTFDDFEIIVVNDGSHDNTRHAVAQFGEDLTYIAHTSNLGVSAARNTGIKKSASPLIAFLDSDDYWLPEKLATQVDFFNNHRDAVACQTEESWIRNGRRVNPKKKHLKPSGDIFEPSLKLCLVSPSAVMLKRTLLEEVGLFDEGLPACEDYDLWLRIASRYPIHLINEHLVVKEGGHPDQLSARHRGMDRFRINSLVKLVKSDKLNNIQLEATLKELSLKCAVYGNGCLKRGKMAEGEYYLRLPDIVKKDKDMKCDKCKDMIQEGEERELHGQTLCEDCYMDALSPARTCDPWAVHSAKSLAKSVGGDFEINEVQAKILRILQETGGVEPRILKERLQLRPSDLERELAALRHMEKIRGKLKEGKKIIILW